MKILILAFLLTGCGWPPMPPEAWTEVASRQVSIRMVGMTAIDPQTGIVFCILCWLSYDRNTGQGPNPGSR